LQQEKEGRSKKSKLHQAPDDEAHLHMWHEIEVEPGSQG